MTALLTLEEIKAHLRVDHDADDEMLMDKVRQATAVLLAYIQGSRDKVISEDGELIPGEALTRMKGAAMRLTGMLSLIHIPEQGGRRTRHDRSTMGAAA
ncbi:head-tail connector protein, partial [Escherichia coli]|uniref:head-tail connector protein n=1 Tax=Escherichia coli TaxID=562 RepID=UPI00201AD8CF